MVHLLVRQIAIGLRQDAPGRFDIPFAHAFEGLFVDRDDHRYQLVTKSPRARREFYVHLAAVFSTG